MNGKFLMVCLLGWILCGFSHTANAQVSKTDCLVMPGNRVKNQFFTDYQGERFYFCCRPCVKSFKKNPEKYLVKLEEH